MITKQLLTISHFIDKIDAVLAQYDSLRWWRSRTGPNGAYEAITAQTPSPAVLLASRVEPYFVAGETLVIEQDGSVVFNAAFPGPDPTSAAAAAAAASSPGVIVGSVDAGRLRLESFTTGLGSSLELMSPDIAARFGFGPVASIGIGTDTALVAGQHEYLLNDPNSDLQYWYKTQFVDSGTGETSLLSVPISADQVRALPDSELIWAYIRLATMTGRPDRQRKVVLVNLRLPNTALAGTVGIGKYYEEMVTDDQGYAQIRIIRGATFDFNIVGTGMVRRITAPTTGAGFNLLDSSLVVEDEYGIHEQGVDFAIRTS